MYSSMIFSIVHRLFMGLYDLCRIWVSLLCFGVILSILNVSGNVLLRIICVVRCVINGAIVLIVLLIMFIDILSCPVGCESGALRSLTVFICLWCDLLCAISLLSVALVFFVFKPVFVVVLIVLLCRIIYVIYVAYNALFC